jgi:hypothetical protein
LSVVILVDTCVAEIVSAATETDFHSFKSKPQWSETK